MTGSRHAIEIAKGNDMKKVLIIAAAMVVSAGAAFAECAKGIETTAAAPGVDREFKTASIAPPTEPAQKPVLVLRKMDRLPGNLETAVVASPESALARMQ